VRRWRRAPGNGAARHGIGGQRRALPADVMQFLGIYAAQDVGF